MNPKSVAMGFCSKGLKKEFETAVVNEPSVFEPLKFYCILSETFWQQSKHQRNKKYKNINYSRFLTEPAQ